jgi:hypothetical protein
MTVMSIPITKGAASIDIDTDKIPQEMYEEALYLGLKEMANRKMSKITVAKLEGEDLAKARAAAMEVAAKNVAEINAGTFKVHGQKASAKVSGAVMTEAMRIARNVIKDTLKAAGHKISHYKAAQITEAAKQIVSQYVAQAEENLAKRAQPPGAIDLSALVTGMKTDPELVAKAEKAKAEKKTQLSAKQAGMVATRAKPTAKASATLN